MKLLLIVATATIFVSLVGCSNTNEVVTVPRLAVTSPTPNPNGTVVVQNLENHPVGILIEVVKADNGLYIRCWYRPTQSIIAEKNLGQIELSNLPAQWSLDGTHWTAFKPSLGFSVTLEGGQSVTINICLSKFPPQDEAGIF